MSQQSGEIAYAFDKPRNYRIRVLGLLDESWSDRLGLLCITEYSTKNLQGPAMELLCKVRDQAELAGLLNKLYELHLSLLSVEYINGE